MEQYISKSALVEEIEKYKNSFCYRNGYLKDIEKNGLVYDTLCGLEDFIKTIEVKYDPLEKFKSLKHISEGLKSTLTYLGYAPYLYYLDGSWYVDWISCKEINSIKCFKGDTAEEAINEAYNWFHSTFCNG